MRTAIYLRKSRSEEGESTAETLSRHKSSLLQFAKAQNLSIVDVYEEVVSGDSLFARPAMLKLLEAVEQSKYEAVLCMDIDRLGRGGMQEQGRILETFKSANTRIITPRKMYDLNNELDETFSEFEAFMARQELKTIKKRMHRGRIKSVEQGCYISNAPFGYENTTINKLPTLKVKEDEADIIRLMFDLYVNQGKGCQTISYMINAMGVKPHRADKFGRTSITKILKNPVYIGKVAFNRTRHERRPDKHKVHYLPEKDWIVVDGHHEGIIPVSLFNKAQEILKGNYHPPSNNGTVENPLAGLVVCTECGGLMQRRPYYNKIRPPSLICPNRGCCSSSYLNVVEDAVLRQLNEMYNAYFLSPKQMLQSDKNSEVYTNALAELNKQLNIVDSQTSKLYDLLEQGIYSIDVFTARMSELNERKQSINIKISDTESLINEKNTLKQNLESIPQLLQNYENLSPHQRNTSLKNIIHKVKYSRIKKENPVIQTFLKG